MKLECSSCSTRYTIDDSIIPPQGAKVRCRKCGEVIVVPPKSAADPVVPAPKEAPVVPPPAVTEPALPPVSYAAPPAPVPPAPPVHMPANAGSGVAGGGVASGGGFSFFPAENAPASRGAQPATSHTVAAPAAEPAGAPPISDALPAEEKKQHEKARRLARVLASDIAIYNREKKDRGLAEGNLVAVLGYEIKKSWEIYKERVGADFANRTPYFRDALNDLLAEGKKIF